MKVHGTAGGNCRRCHERNDPERWPERGDRVELVIRHHCRRNDRQPGGARLMGVVAQKMTDSFFDCVRKRIEEN